MRAVIQRAKDSKCVIEGKVTGKINFGYVVLVGFTEGDNLDTVKKMAKKIANLRIFNDENGKMNKSILDVKGEILSISQFTLYANTNSGNRPSFTESLNPVDAENLYNLFNLELKNYGIKVEEGIFQSEMKISLTNFGPVTITLEF